MDEENEPAIPFAYNKHEVEHDIDEADPKEPYFCRECRVPVVQRRGDERRDHFAHTPNSPVRSCPWLTTEGVRESLARIREEAIQEQTGRIRVFLQADPYSEELRLFGSIPCISPRDLASLPREAIGRTLKAEGTLRPITLRSFLPSQGRALFELDPAAPHCEVSVEPAGLSIGGTWRAPGLGSKAFFVGDTEGAEWVAEPRHLSAGDSVYLLVPSSETHLFPAAIHRSLGARTVLRIDDTKTSLGALANVRGSELFLDDEPLRVDVVLPFSCDPRAQQVGLVRAPKGSRAVIAIHPPVRMDPELSLIPIPFYAEGVVEIGATGPGKPRFVQVDMDKFDSSRLLIHVTGRMHRDVVLDFVVFEDVRQEDGPFSAAEYWILVSNPDGDLVLDPMLAPTFDWTPLGGSEDVSRLPPLSLHCPPTFLVRLTMSIGGADRSGAGPDNRLVSKENFESALRAAFEAGVERIDASFGAIGSVILTSSFLHGQWVAGRNRENASEQQRKVEREAHVAVQRARIQQEFEERERVQRRSMLEGRIDTQLKLQAHAPPKHVSRAWVARALEPERGLTEADLDSWRRFTRRRIKDMGLRRRAPGWNAGPGEEGED